MPARRRIRSWPKVRCQPCWLCRVLRIRPSPVMVLPPFTGPRCLPRRRSTREKIPSPWRVRGSRNKVDRGHRRPGDSPPRNRLETPQLVSPAGQDFEFAQPSATLGARSTACASAESSTRRWAPRVGLWTWRFGSRTRAPARCPAPETSAGYPLRLVAVPSAAPADRWLGPRSHQRRAFAPHPAAPPGT